MVSSRLDRLFILLDTGSNESIRLAAAKQLGEVQRVQPNDLNFLLKRIREYSSKSVWETRVAAGHAVHYILEHVEPWPSNLADKIQESKDNCRRDIANKFISQNVNTEEVLTQFDLEKIISFCPKLLSLDTNDVESDSPSSSRGSSRVKSSSRRESTSRKYVNKQDRDQLLRQRKLINKELGIVDSMDLGVKSTDIVSNDDLQIDYDTSDLSNSCNQSDAKLVLRKYISNYDKLIETLYQENYLVRSTSPSTQHVWPLSDTTKKYTEDLFNPSWEIRHGAAICLREIIKAQGKSAGRRSDLADESNNIINQLWLVDMAIQSICVLALDKFGDFLFDQVVAPVRENVAQLLSCCVSHMTESNSISTLNVLLRMLQATNWETRHGSVLGLKYFLHVFDESHVEKIVGVCFEPIFKSLADSVDDVSAEAAAALVPIKDLMMKTIPEKTPKLIKFLWEHLANLDELTTSTSNIVLLLASLITSSSTELEPTELTKSIPRLWSLLGHSSTSVRISVLRALVTLLRSQDTPCVDWMPTDLLTTALRLVFQRSILENNDEVRHHLGQVWMQLIEVRENKPDSQTNRINLLKCTSIYLSYWFCLVMQPSNVPIDRSSAMWLNIDPHGQPTKTKPDGEVFIGSSTFNAETINQQRSQVLKCRLTGAKLIGYLYATLVNDFSDSPESQHSRETLKYLADMFIHYMKTKSGNQRIFAGWALESWAEHQTILITSDFGKLQSILPPNLIEQLDSAIRETSLCYDELATSFTSLQQEARDLVATALSLGLILDPKLPTDKRTIYNFNQIQTFCDIDIEVPINGVSHKKSNVNSKLQKLDNEKSIVLFNKKTNLSKSLKQTQLSQKALSTSVLSSLACAHIAWRLIPQKLKLIVDPLLDSIEFEDEKLLQDKAIDHLVILIDVLCEDLDKHSDLIDSILDRLVNDLCIRTLSSSTDNVKECSDNGVKSSQNNQRIVLLDNLQRMSESSRRQSNSNISSGLKRSYASISSTDHGDSATTVEEENQQSHTLINDQVELKLRGSTNALRKIVCHFSDSLPKKLPNLWSSITSKITTGILDHQSTGNHESTSETDVELIKNLKTLEVVGLSLCDNLRTILLDFQTDLSKLLRSPNHLLRHHSGQCISVICKSSIDKGMVSIDSSILPMLEENNILARSGAIEAIALIIEKLQIDLVPKINKFVLHILRRMSDQNDQVRLVATHCFGKLLSLMPLNMNKSPGIAGNNKDLERHEDQVFIEQLLDPKKLENYGLPFMLNNVELRSYQQDGLNWLAFLNRYNLHGILCDEMGLGKTLMTMCMVASDHVAVRKEGQQTVSTLLPSLIVCPPTLTEHWLYEMIRFLPIEVRKELNPTAYSGSVNDRVSLRGQIMPDLNRKHSLVRKPIYLVVASYDIVRNDIEFFKSVQWNYCVLDEGHMIKNGRTKLSRAIKLISAKHRLILSGTPIQNNVTELWSLFDFLMPGFLGTERQFNTRYSKPILQSREPKCSSRDMEAGALAMESLHRQVLPFILRRLKEDVLDDLPPKIIQDYYCELSPLQTKLYEDFTRSKLCKDVTRKSLENLSLHCDNEQSGTADYDMKTSSKSHVFQALQYLKNVCNHPKLVLDEKHCQYSEIKKSLDCEKSSLDDISHSSKLNALKQLLIDCGIGVINNTGCDEQQQRQDLALQSVVNQHRALIFCQIRSMVNIIENDLFKKHLPNITYLRLDGSVPTNQRQSIVEKFNNDPSIDILLLTTQIGGLGLNLTGADTVIFVEHDWNPTKDLQAMDRAHRIGQKKVVNVYRLITKGTLEEKIMGLQKFKTMVSNTVINQDNAGLNTMNIDQLFDLFNDTTGDSSTNSAEAHDTRRKQAATGGGGAKSSFIDLLPELWDQQQYETEYDLSNFVSSLKK